VALAKHLWGELFECGFAGTFSDIKLILRAEQQSEQVPHWDKIPFS
jgi:hypothetical protein